HRMEEVLAALRDGGAPVTGPVVDALFACLDTLQEMVDRVAAGDEAEVDAGGVLARLDAAAAGAPPAGALAETAATLAAPAPAAGPSGAEALGDYDRMLVREARERGLEVLRVGVRLGEECLLAGARAVMVARELEALGDVIASDPPAEAIERDEIEGRLVFWVATAAGAEAVREAVTGVSDVAEAAVDAVVDDGPAGAAAAPSAPGPDPGP